MHNEKVEKRSGFYIFLSIIAKAFEKLFFNIKIQGLNTLPLGQKAILCANHTSNIDSIILMIRCNRNIYFLAKKELFKTKFSAWFFEKLNVICVDRQGTDAAAIKKALRVLKDEKLLGIYPEGTTKKGGKQLIEPKAGALMIALAAKAPIIPVAIYGKYKFRGKVIIKAGQPIYFNEYYGQKYKTEELVQITQDRVMSKIKSMLEQAKDELN
ncbi:MAG: 1-acyl-sn-glycerol-3-phosphate acyltransferase [Eubacteriaceae bacterium]|nr:1-acyl-sn-glycerol-3-phosphate acyltransferase [Eubacteriaceae bacterium]